jgi:amino acid adenylation domain-containing protein
MSKDQSEIAFALAQDVPEPAKELVRAESEGEAFPVSYAQERLWFLEELAPGQATYNISIAVSFKGNLDVSALRQSLKIVVGRHETLRTRFSKTRGEPVQIIEECDRIELRITDLRDLADCEKQKAAARWMKTESGQPFDLRQAPLSRWHLLQLDQTNSILVINLHHIISDGWSMGVLVKEMSACYMAVVTGAKLTLPELPVQYADYSVWQREWLGTGELRQQLQFWKERLQGLPTLELPADRPRMEIQEHRGMSTFLNFGEELSLRIREWSRKQGLTVFMTLLSALQVLILRLTGQKDVPIGTAIANRSRSELEPLIGFFANTLVLRGDLSGDPSFRNFAARNRESMLQAHANQDVPFEQVVKELHPERELTRMPLVQVVLVLQNVPLPELKLPGLEVSASGIHNDTSKFDWLISLQDREKEIQGFWEYDVDLFDEDTVKRIAGFWMSLLRDALANDWKRLSAVEILSCEEQHRLLRWGSTAVEYPAEKCLAQLFEEQVQRSPDAIAAIVGEAQFSYQALNRKANQLARYLQSRGAGPETRIGIAAQRSIQTVLGLLAIAKSGAAYVPLDPSYPEERLQFMMTEAGISLLLSESGISLPSHDPAAATVMIDQCETLLDQFSSENLVTNVLPDNLAYVIFTSGSTGRPKGNLITHFNVVRLFQATRDVFHFDENDVWTLFHSLGFDFSVWEFWGPLITGGRFVLVSPEHRLSPEDFYQLLISEQVTVLNQTPSSFRQLMRVDSQEQSQGLKLRHVIFGGEALDVQSLEGWFNRHGDAYPRLTNMYGITETTVHVTFREIKAVDLETGVKSPIGKPIRDLQTFIVDEDFNLFPIGVPGELYVGGSGLARGYLNRPDLTAERFLPNPFSSRPGARWYKTGDLAKCTREQEAEFLGRKDRQVKIRGFRIELPEIEAILNRHLTVRESVVLVEENETSGPRLIAYVVGDKQVGAGETERPRVADWQFVFDEIYTKPSTAGVEFNVTGWNSSYTDEPIPAEEMLEWVDAIVARILALRPTRVLEIGCGTGLLLFRIAPHCAAYHGTDFSSEVLAQLKSSGICHRFPQVKLTQAAADDFSSLGPEKFDTIILNSVVQYFPDVHYLVRVLECAMKALAPQGRIVLGDLRNLQWMEAFHLSVASAQNDPAIEISDLRSQMLRGIEQESELLISPEFFAAASKAWPIEQMEMVLKRGRFGNEMTRFRYDAILHSSDCQVQESPSAVRDFEQEKLTFERLREILHANTGSSVLIKNIPNSRVHSELQLLKRNRAGEFPGKDLASVTNGNAFDPEELSRLGEEFSYEPVPYLSGTSSGCFHMWYRKRNTDWTVPLDKDMGWRVEKLIPDWQQYANVPVRRRATSALLPELRRYVREALPEYMCPSLWVELDRLPLTANGKLDRKALPKPESRGAETATSPAGSLTELEELLAGIWGEMLSVDSVGLHDNFFTDLGGHSLLATQVMSRVKEVFGIEIPLRSIFENPTLARLTVCIGEQLKGHKTEQHALHISVAQRPELLPLSHAQERIWFLEQMGLRVGTYHISVGVRLRGAVDLQAVKSSLEEVAARHETLRTRFELRDGKPTQVIAPDSRVDLPLWDLSALGDDEIQSEYKRLRSTARTRRFDLQKGEVWRAGMVRMADSEHVLILVLHHIAADGWSLGVLVKEVAELFKARIEHRAPQLAELKIQYADYALWQREWLQGSELETQLSYWRTQLQGATRIELTPNVDRKIPGDQRAGRIVKRLRRDLTELVKKLGRENGATLFMISLAMLDVLLWRYTREWDVTVGTAIANRNRREIENLIGFFVNTMVLRVSLHGDPTVRDVLARVREATLGAYAHQDVPFEKVVGDLQPERDLQRTPFFGIMLVLQNAPMEELKLKGLETIIEDEDIDSTKFDLVVNVTDTTDGLKFNFDYNAALFDAEKIQRLADHYENLLQGAVNDPGRRLSELEMIGRDAGELLERGNLTDRHWDCDVTVAQLFEKQVQQTPETLAVIMNEEKLTYRELNARANQLARYLLRAGVEPEITVGICMERSPDLLVGLLGILKAGGAYVPLDPSYPPERLNGMARACNLEYVIIRSGLARLFAENEALTAICLDKDWPAIVLQNCDNLQHETDTSHLAYVLHTSGSSGAPKGVMIEQRSLVNYLRWVNEALLQDVDRLPAITNLSFDASLKQLFAPLLVGKTVYLIGDVVKEPDALIKLLQTSDRVGLNCVPAVWRVLIESMRREMAQGFVDGTQFTHLFMGGESMPEDLVAESLQLLPHLKIVNLYGPTEATANATCAFVLSPAGVSLGRPVANTRVYVLNQGLQSMPAGEAGELFIGGAGIARGYLSKPELTAEKFLPDPFSKRGGGRLYRTGDLARYLKDGTLEYLGRVDRQVKLRGHRIELSEIEAVIRKHQDVQDCVVVAQERRGEKRLLAYFICRNGAKLQADDLRVHARSKLPEFMMPSSWTRLDKLPLNSHGKLDLNSLPQPSEADAELNLRYVAPRNQVEDLLAGVWQEVLDMEQVGVEHNFFNDLGGHSLLAVQAMSRIREVLQLEIPLRMLFELPTIAMLSARLMASPEWRFQIEQVSRLYRELENLSEGEIDSLLHGD